MSGQDVPPVFTFDAEQDETNNLVVEQTGAWELVFSDAVALTAGEGCVPLSEKSARCTVGGWGAISNISLGDNDDTASMILYGQTANVFAGEGRDSVFADSHGQRTFVYGEEGDDTVKASGDSGQTADGGSGNDIVTAFLPCAGTGNAKGFGGPGDDTVRFTNCSHSHQSATTLDGGSGADLIVADPVGYPSAVDGGDGNDIVRINSDPYLFGPFTIMGGSGDDALHAGDGADTVSAGDGNDYVDVQGKGADVVTCGAGSDIVLYDASDTVSDDCEVRSKNGRLAWFPPASGAQSFGLFGSLGTRWR